MRSFGLYTLFAAAATELALAASDPTALAIVKQQFTNAHIVPDDLPSFDPTGLLTVAFKNGTVSVGQALTQSGTSTQPNVTVQGLNSTSPKYTLMMVDFDYAGSNNTGEFYLHWLSNNNALGSNGTLTPSDVTEPYGGPAPPSGSGAHRYTILLYAEPSNFTIPSIPKPRAGVQQFNFTQYVKTTGLGTPLAGFYFTVEVGTATVTAESITPVNIQTFTLSSGTSKPTSAPQSSSTSKKNAADRTTATGFIGALSSFMFALLVTM